MRNLRAFAAGFAGDRRLRQPRWARLHHERMVERVPGAGDIRRGRLLALMAHIIADEMPRDAELYVGLEELVILHVDLRDQRLEAVLDGEKMQMRGAHIV